MNLWQSLKTAYRGLVTNKLRSFLTLLGIMIGVGAVVAMISIGTGASFYVSDQIRNLGSNLLIVTPGRAGGEGRASQAQGTGTNLTMADADAIKHEVTGIKQMSPELSGQAQVIYRDKNVNSSISGVTETYEAVHNFHALYGDFISQDDQKVGAAVAVLGQNVVVNLFGQANPIGAVIKIKNVPFKVIGIMESKGSGSFGNQDDAIFIPLATAQRRLFGSDYLQSIYIQVTTESQVPDSTNQVTRLLLSRHRITDQAAKDFNVSSQADILSTVSQITGVLTILLGGIAAISLLVGGIGIMNIMLVSVTERTREIGLRKAVGAHGRDILFQFLLESVVLSLIGGIIGLGLGSLGGMAIAQYGGWPMVISLNSVLLALGFSAGIGIFFGVYPARRASRLNPIDALRYE